jgi:hypothetical protein
MSDNITNEVVRRANILKNDWSKAVEQGQAGTYRVLGNAYEFGQDLMGNPRKRAVFDELLAQRRVVVRKDTPAFSCVCKLLMNANPRLASAWGIALEKAHQAKVAPADFVAYVHVNGGLEGLRRNGTRKQADTRTLLQKFDAAKAALDVSKPLATIDGMAETPREVMLVLLIGQTTEAGAVKVLKVVTDPATVKGVVARLAPERQDAEVDSKEHVRDLVMRALSETERALA